VASCPEPGKNDDVSINWTGDHERVSRNGDLLATSACPQLSTSGDRRGQQYLYSSRRLVIGYGHWPVLAERVCGLNGGDSVSFRPLMVVNGAYRSRFVPPAGRLLSVARTGGGQKGGRAGAREGDGVGEDCSIALQHILHQSQLDEARPRPSARRTAARYLPAGCRPASKRVAATSRAIPETMSSSNKYINLYSPN